MDKKTVDVYETRGREWTTKRKPLALDHAAAFAARAQGPCVDLGCGPGFYTAALPPPVVALDAARTMLEQVPERAPSAWLVHADVEALPFRRGALGSAWARSSYVHLPRAALPMALADLHRAMRVGGAIEFSLFAGAFEGTPPESDDDFPGRWFSQWDPGALADVLIGAGFALDQLEERVNPAGDTSLIPRGHRARTLPDIVGPGMRMLVCGLNPSLFAADAGIGFARPGNRFWPAALRAGIVSRDRDPRHALAAHGVGMTDLVKRATVGADELTAGEYRDGFARVERLAAWLRPNVVAFVGLSGWRAAVDRKATVGVQPREVGGRPAYVLPNPSGLNAHTNVDDIAGHLRAAYGLASQ